ncbi:MAG: hypothetical protein ACRC5R_06350 [Mycoplasmatales bacterium]
MSIDAVIPNLPAIIMQLLATLFMVLFLKKKTYKMYLDYMNRRTNFVNEAIETADVNKKSSEEVLKGLQDEKEEIKSTKKELYNEVIKEGNLEKNVIINDAKSRARQILEKAQKEVESEKDGVARELSEDVFDYASLVASKFMISSMTKEDEEKLIQEAISKVSNEN